MGNLSEEKKLKFLLIVGGFIVTAIIYLLVFGLDVDADKSPKKIGFIILGDINEPGWNASHYNGIKAACEDFGLELLIRDNIPENTGQCPIAVEELVAEGAGIIFLMSFDYVNEIPNLIEKYPRISFVNTSTQQRAKNLTSCFAKMYQGRYMTGALAGMKTKSNVIGYVAAIPNAEVCRGINAFAFGVQRVNPNARILVMWTGSWQNEAVETEHAKILIEKYGADILTYHQDEDAVGKVAESHGVDFIAYNALLSGYSDHYLTSIICSWDVYYRDILQRYLKGELISMRNNWLGVRENVISLSEYSRRVTPEMRAYIDTIKNELTFNDNLIFYNEIYDNQGNLRCGKNQVFTEHELLSNINWLVKGVEVVE